VVFLICFKTNHVQVNPESNSDSLLSFLLKMLLYLMKLTHMQGLIKSRGSILSLEILHVQIFILQ